MQTATAFYAIQEFAIDTCSGVRDTNKFPRIYSHRSA